MVDFTCKQFSFRFSFLTLGEGGLLSYKQQGEFSFKLRLKQSAGIWAINVGISVTLEYCY